jgi:endo-1,4-beta-xylanase
VTGGKAGFYFRILNSTVFIFLFCIVVILPGKSFSQPLAAGKNKFLGNAITDGYSIPSNYLKYWNQVTPGNDGKWGMVEFSPGSYSWSHLDDIYNYANSNGLIFKEHNLIWGQQQPSFMTDNSLDSAQEYQEVVNWIQACGQRYPLAAFCDVVNEPFHAPPPYANALGGSGTTGWDWVITAFQLARQFFSPGTKLLINDYNILQDNTVTSNFIALIDTLKVRGLIDGIGIQGHYFEFKSPQGASPSYSYPVSTIKYNLNRLTATGLPVYISEFDINEADDNVQLQNYQIYFPLFWENPGVKGMTLWGYNQYDTWKPNAYLVTSRRAERPALTWLRTYLATYLMSTLISPDSATNVQRNPLLTWYTSTAATNYHVQVALDTNFTSTVVDSTVADTLLQLGPLSANTKYYWHVSAYNSGDTGSYSAVASFTTSDRISDVKETYGLPKEFALNQNYPNPFNPTTIINYQLPKISFVTLKVYDVLGREVKELVNGEQDAGTYTVNFNASGLSSGIYFYRIEAGSFSQVKKMLLLK